MRTVARLVNGAIDADGNGARQGVYAGTEEPAEAQRVPRVHTRVLTAVHKRSANAALRAALLLPRHYLRVPIAVRPAERQQSTDERGLVGPGCRRPCRSSPATARHASGF